MQIIIVRHASTRYNERNLINGQHDDRISLEGQKELPGLVKKLKAYDFTEIYSSPLKRALDTAKCLAQDRNISIKVDQRLLEVNFGSFTSKNWQSMRKLFGMSSTELLNSYSYDLRPYGGESSNEVKKRAESFLRDLVKNSTSKPLIVTHNGIIRWFDLICTKQKTSGLANSDFKIYDVNSADL